jgi:hypothetical protein
MPEPIEQPAQPTEQPAAPAPEAPAKKKRARKSPDQAVLDRIKKKYRLDAEVSIAAQGADGSPLGRGLLMDPEVLNKLNELDTSPDKRYLDWMLYQAGGGATTFKHSMEMWGEGSPEVPPEEFFRKFRAEVSNRVTPNEVNAVARSLSLPELPPLTNDIIKLTYENDDAAKFGAIIALLKEKDAAPGKEERVASDLLSTKLKQWIRDQLDTKVRDRVHAVFVFSRILRRMDPQTAEQEWRDIEAKRKREYLFGDQDSLKWLLFGFSRHWPGKDNRYENVYNEMRQFLINKERVERRNAELGRYNTAIQSRNAQLPPGQQTPLREPVDVDLEIGKVTLNTKGHLAYKGHYPTIQELAKANEEIVDLPMRERVGGDIRYATSGHQWGRDAKIYSDANLDVMVPLTVAASVRSGHPEWPVSDPEQLKAVRSKGHYPPSEWMMYAAKQHHHAEWQESQAIPIFFHLKSAGAPEKTRRIMMTTFVDDVVELQPPYSGTFWRMAGAGEDLGFSQLITHLKTLMPEADYFNTVRSITKAMKAIRDWGQGFDPGSIVGDYIAHYRERMQGKRGLREEVTIRARQVVEKLLE